ncbi:hypothetical protein BH10BAC2_BH10BAC2_08040 [soil metagenome]
MIQKRISLPLLLIIALLFSCSSHKTQTEVTLILKGAAGKKVFLYREPFINEVAVKLDSALVIDLNRPVHFIVSDTEEHLYRLRVDQSGNSYYFINDIPKLQIEANEINGKYMISASPASISLKTFNEKQSLVSDSLRLYVKEMKNLPKNAAVQFDSMKSNYDKKFAVFLNSYINYADTVKSAAAFMATYANIEFGSNYLHLKSFVDNAVIRFPGYKPVIDLRAETYDMIDIFEKEYNVGDTLPFLELHSSSGQKFSTEALRGKYYLVDFWATWHPQASSYNDGKKQLWKNYKDKGLRMVSVALDDEKDKWLNMINADNLNWIQLIDEKMWRGAAAKTLKFDSIPFNFFVDPDGCVLEKAIKPDSLIAVIGKYIK